MVDINVVFCRHLLSEATKLVKAFRPNVQLKCAWVYHFGRDHWEFHGPEAFYWHGSADNAYDARYKGWMAWLEKQGAFNETDQN